MSQEEHSDDCIKPENIQKFCRIIRSRKTKIACVCIIILSAIVLFLDNFYKHAYYPGEKAALIAIGIANWENGYKIPRDNMPSELLVPTCKQVEENDPPTLPYYRCVMMDSMNPSYCGFFRDESCQPYYASSHLLQEPDKLARAVDAVLNPCKYLPGPEKWEEMSTQKYIENVRKHNGYYNQDTVRYFKDMWKKAHCDKPEAERKSHPIYIFFREDGREVMRIIKHAKPD